MAHDSISRRGSLTVWKGPVIHRFAATYCVIWGMSLPLLVSVSSSSNHKEEAKMIPRSAVTLGVSNSVDFSEILFSLKELFSSSILFGHSLCFLFLLIPQNFTSRLPFPGLARHPKCSKQKQHSRWSPGFLVHTYTQKVDVEMDSPSVWHDLISFGVRGKKLGKSV